jgi:hypothetical protein
MSALPDTGTERVARWSIGGVFLEALATRDYSRMASTLAPAVRFRAMLPRGPMAWEGADAVAEAFDSWFGQADDFEVVDATVGELGSRLHLCWRIRVRPAPFGIGEGWHLVEQQAYADTNDIIQTLDLLCSGFQPEQQLQT